MSREIIYSVSIALAICVSFFLTKFSLHTETLFILTTLFIAVFLLRRFRRGEYFLEAILITCAVLLLVNSTGGLASPFFSLEYFLIFALSLLLDPFIGLSASIMLVVFYLLLYQPEPSATRLFPLFSLMLLSPFAMFLSFQLEKNTSLRNKMSRSKEDTFLFLTLVVKNHLNSIRELAQKHRGDHDTERIIKNTDRLTRLINRFEQGEDS